MAREKDVRLHQVWKAKVSGKLVDVEVVGAAGETGSGRTKFLLLNLSTNRTTKGTAGKLKTLVRDVSPHGDPAAIVTPPSSGRPAAARRPSREERVLAAAATSQLPPHVIGALREAELPRPPDPPALGSLRAGRPRKEVFYSDGTGRPSPVRTNPANYPSAAARRAAEAIAASGAQTPAQVLGAVQRAFSSSNPPEHGPPTAWRPDAPPPPERRCVVCYDRLFGPPPPWAPSGPFGLCMNCGADSRRRLAAEQAWERISQGGQVIMPRGLTQGGTVDARPDAYYSARMGV